MAQAIAQRIDETPRSRLGAAAALTVGGLTLLALGAVWLSGRHHQTRFTPGILITLGGGTLLAACSCFCRRAAPMPAPPAPYAREAHLLAEMRTTIQAVQANPTALENEVEERLLAYLESYPNRIQACQAYLRLIGNDPQWREQFGSETPMGRHFARTVDWLIDTDPDGEDWQEVGRVYLAILRHDDWAHHPEWAPMAWRLVNDVLKSLDSHWYHFDREPDDAPWAQMVIDLLNATRPLWLAHAKADQVALLPVLEAWHRSLEPHHYAYSVTPRLVQSLAALVSATRTGAPWAIPMLRQSLARLVQRPSDITRAIGEQPQLMAFLEEGGS